jgi:nifR3 family TIM-barrel protein
VGNLNDTDQRAGATRNRHGLRPLTVGGVNLGLPVILAPMSGVTDLPFRRIAGNLGAGLLVSEMIASWAMVRENRNTLRMAAVTGGGVNAVQLAGCDPGAMAEAARIAVAGGADLIDINFGCPVKKVAVGQSAGSALMRDEVAAAALLAATARAVDVPVTLKMRMGWDHDSLNAPRFAAIAEECGIAMVTVHGRTRQQFYTGQADWRFIGAVKAAVRIPVIANGDILDEDDAAEALALSGADGVMIGRGSLSVRRRLPRPPVAYSPKIHTSRPLRRYVEPLRHRAWHARSAQACLLVHRRPARFGRISRRGQPPRHDGRGAFADRPVLRPADRTRCRPPCPQQNGAGARGPCRVKPSP